MEADYHLGTNGALISEEGTVVLAPPDSEGYSDDSKGSEGQTGHGPCLVYAEVGGVWYLDLEQSKKDSPRGFSEGTILEASRKARPEVPLLGGLEMVVVEERRREVTERWKSQPKGRHERSISSAVSSTSAFP